MGKCFDALVVWFTDTSHDDAPMVMAPLFYEGFLSIRFSPITVLILATKIHVRARLYAYAKIIRLYVLNQI